MSCSILAPPFLVQYPHSKVESIEGNPVTLTCRARGNPKPAIQWSKEGISLAYDPHYRILPSGDLYILEVRVVDHGMYRCRAANRVGAVAATTRLIVTGNRRHLSKKTSFFRLSGVITNQDLERERFRSHVPKAINCFRESETRNAIVRTCLFRSFSLLAV